MKSQLITSDYSGLIQLWDAATAGEVAQFDEHARRVWSVDFSAADPMKFLRCVGGGGGSPLRGRRRAGHARKARCVVLRRWLTRNG